MKYTADGTPLGDYAVPLTLNLTPPTGTAKTLQLLKNTAILAGVPYGSVAQPPALGGLGGWTLVAKGTDIGRVTASLRVQAGSGDGTINRLAANALEDMLLVCYFAPRN